MKHIARKRFGQNFLTDINIINRIVSEIAICPTDNIVEIGPGFGAITKPILKQADRLTVIEIDRDLAQNLQALNHPNLTVFVEDALKFDFPCLYDGRKIRIIGNLPYNISTPLMFHLLAFKYQIEDMHFMLQQELVERICATPNNKIYGRLSVILQANCEVEKLFNVPKESFNPAPKVGSAMIRIKPKSNITVSLFFEQVVKTAFAKRRKTLRNNFKEFVTSSVLDNAPIDLSLRAEALSVAQFIKLSDYFEQNQ